MNNNSLQKIDTVRLRWENGKTISSEIKNNNDKPIITYKPNISCPICFSKMISNDLENLYSLDELTKPLLTRFYHQCNSSKDPYKKSYVDLFIITNNILLCKNYSFSFIHKNSYFYLCGQIDSELYYNKFTLNYELKPSNPSNHNSTILYNEEERIILEVPQVQLTMENNTPNIKKIFDRLIKLVPFS
jgi:hypothetical protein